MLQVVCPTMLVMELRVMRRWRMAMLTTVVVTMVTASGAAVVVRATSAIACASAAASTRVGHSKSHLCPTRHRVSWWLDTQFLKKPTAA